MECAFRSAVLERKTWAAIPGGTVTNNILVWRQFTFAALSTSKIRVLTSASADGIWSRITEVEAYANVSTFPGLFDRCRSVLGWTLVQGDNGTSSVTVTHSMGLPGTSDLP